jgi:hypothetical protein
MEKKKVGEVPPVLGSTAIKPVERSGWQAVKHFLYSPETGAFCSRTPKSWVLILSFFLLLYTFLAGFWFLMMQVCRQFLS